MGPSVLFGRRHLHNETQSDEAKTEKYQLYHYSDPRFFDRVAVPIGESSAETNAVKISPAT